MTDHPRNASQQMINQLFTTIILPANQHIKVKNLYFLSYDETIYNKDYWS